MSEEKIYPPPPAFAARALVNAATYDTMYRDSVENTEAFWAKQARERLTWIKPFTQVKDTSFDANDLHVRWFADGQLNVSANCLDRHLQKRPDQTAILWEPDDPNEPHRMLSYRELHERVCRFANALKRLGVQKGDRVTIYMPMIPQTVTAMLACARIGAVHSVVFGGFSPEALKGRIEDCGSKVVITADEGVRGGKKIPLKANVDEAIAGLKGTKVDAVVVVRRTGGKINWVEGRDHWYYDLKSAASPVCPPEPMSAEDPLFILYTSGSTGKPKGVLHTTGGYLLHASITHQYVFDYRDGDVFWCAADVGWVTGHSYIVYGPLANGATSVMFEGVPTYPDASRLWQVVDKHGVNIIYMAPTAIRALMREGDGPVKKTSRRTLKLLGTVGEPINPEAWEWYYHVVGDARCPIVDTWWQTETGAMMMTPLPGAIGTKPGSCTVPFFGVSPKVLREDGSEAAPNEGGLLVIDKAWPSMLRGVHNDDARFGSYFERFPGKYFTGDGARRDEDGYFWVMGRVDDVVNVAGHRLGTAEIESALVSHPAVAEAAVVARPDELKGSALVAFVTLKLGQTPDEGLRAKLIEHVGNEIGKFAKPDGLRFAAALPKTRSGKIMRRFLKDIASGKAAQGDTTTLEDMNVLAQLAGADE